MEEPEAFSPKMHRFRLSTEQKQLICRHKAANPNLSLRDMQAWAKATLHLDIGRTTVYDILRMSEKWVEGYDKRKHMCQQPTLEVALNQWYRDQQVTGLKVTDRTLVAQAQHIGHKLGKYRIYLWKYDITPCNIIYIVCWLKSETMSQLLLAMTFHFLKCHFTHIKLQALHSKFNVLCYCSFTRCPELLVLQGMGVKI